MQVTLGAAQETLLIPLYGRARLTREGSALINDRKAVEMVDLIAWDFTRFDGTPSLVGSVLRTRMFDVWVRDWSADNPDGTVVEVGAGLNTRFERVDNGRVRWVDLDLPDAMALRRRFFTESGRRSMIDASVTDQRWVDTVGRMGPGPWFFVAEAVLCFLEESEVREALATIGRHFPGSTVAFDTWGTWMRDNQDQHDAMRAVDARVVWFCEEPRAIETWGLGFRLVDSHTLAELPAELDSLIPESVRAGMASPEAAPQVRSYKLSLFEVGAP